jgi:hypothetical protein
MYFGPFFTNWPFVETWPFMRLGRLWDFGGSYVMANRFSLLHHSPPGKQLKRSIWRPLLAKELLGFPEAYI